MVGYALTTAAVPQKPEWLEALLSEKFFAACVNSHLHLKKNERNIFCVDCSVGICQHCLPSHTPHRLLQIRRYVYHDVIRLHDVQKLVDCSFVQAYIINSARVVFLNQRPQLRPSKGLGNTCATCDRNLQEGFRYCSVGCKVEAFVRECKNMQELLPHCNYLHISCDTYANSSSLQKTCSLEEEQLSPTSALEAVDSPSSSSSTANDCHHHNMTMWGRSDKSKRSRNVGHSSPSPTSVILPSLKSRRKSITPHRSPLF